MMVDRLYEHILAPTNLQPADRAAYRLALALAQSSQSRLTLLHVLPEEPQEAYAGLDAIKLMHLAAEGSPSRVHRARSLTPERREALLGRLRAEIHSEWLASLQVATEVRCGDKVEEIARAIEELQVDLVVMASPRARWLPRFGQSVADRLSRQTNVKIVSVFPPARMPARASTQRAERGD